MSNSTSNPLAHNPESQGDLWVKVTIPIYVVTLGIVCLRLWWRRSMAGKFAKTDIFVVVSLLCALVQQVLGCIAILKWGLGHHAAYIGRYKTGKAMMYFYIYQIFYKILVGTTKLSFIALYLDLFPTRAFRITCHVVQGTIYCAIVAFVFGTMFQCTPIPYFWNRNIKGGKCIDTAAFWYGHAAWNTIMDVIVLLLPVPVIRSLRIGRTQKIAVLGVFGLGAFVIVASVMRMIALNPASKVTQADMTYVISTSNALLWTQVESCVAIICVCLPTLKGLIAKVIPNLFSTKGRSTKESYHLKEIENSWRAKVGKSVRMNDSASQESIFGIKKTVMVEVDTEEGHTIDSREIFGDANRV